MNEASMEAMTEAPEPSIQLLAEAAQNEARLLIDPQLKGPIEEPDDRSSSLSDIEDRLGPDAPTDKAPSKSPEPTVDNGNDTEAETEHLQPTPYKSRISRTIVMSESGDQGSQEPEPSSTAAVEGAGSPDSSPAAKPGSADASDAPSPTSEMSSLEDSGASVGTSKSPMSDSGRKRKRSTGEGDVTAQSLKRAAMELATQIADHSDPAEPEEKTETVLNHGAIITADVSEVEMSENEEQGKEVVEAVEAEPEVDSPRSTEEDDAAEEAAAEADPTSTARNEEEILKKKSALDVLSTIEKDFASLRDRLFSERTRQLNDELATLDGPDITHPEYLAMVRSISAQRLERVELARTTLQYKVTALKTKSVAGRVQLHSQYAQTVRELRDEALRCANRTCYQLQQERRRMDREGEGRASHLLISRPELVAQQSAYNLEVSILSGIAKHVGFPAAPEMEAATTDERMADLRKMGISPPPVSAALPTSAAPHTAVAIDERAPPSAQWINTPHSAPAPSNPLSAAAPRLPLTATPHHHHHHHHHHRNHPHNRDSSPLTPWAQRRPQADAQAAHGSASTVAAGPSSSHNPTPATAEPAPGPTSAAAGLTQSTRAAHPQLESVLADTPSRPPLHNHTEPEHGPETGSEGARAPAMMAAAPAREALASPRPRSRDPMMGATGERIRAGFGQPPGFAPEVKVGNA